MDQNDRFATTVVLVIDFYRIMGVGINLHIGISDLRSQVDEFCNWLESGARAAFGCERRTESFAIHGRLVSSNRSSEQCRSGKLSYIQARVNSTSMLPRVALE